MGIRSGVGADNRGVLEFGGFGYLLSYLGMWLSVTLGIGRRWAV